MSEEFRFAFRTHADFADTDVTGVVYYGAYAGYVDRGVFAYRRHLGLDPLGPPGHHYMVKASEFVFHDSLRFGDEVDVGVRVSRIGRTSHEYHVAVDRVTAGERVRCADARVTVVGVDGYGSAARATPLPDAERVRYAEFDGPV